MMTCKKRVQRRNLMHTADPLPGNIHDAKAIRETGLTELLGDDNTVGDKGYIGTGVTTCITNQSAASSPIDRKSSTPQSTKFAT
jgi:hypothetical protein